MKQNKAGWDINYRQVRESVKNKPNSYYPGVLVSTSLQSEVVGKCWTDFDVCCGEATKTITSGFVDI